MADRDDYDALMSKIWDANREHRLIGYTWRHYKGSIYKVENLTIDANTNEVIVHYRPMSLLATREVTFSRPLSEWFEIVGEVQRFVKVDSYSLYMTPGEYSMCIYRQK